MSHDEFEVSEVLLQPQASKEQVVIPITDDSEKPPLISAQSVDLDAEEDDMTLSVGDLEIKEAQQVAYDEARKKHEKEIVALMEDFAAEKAEMAQTHANTLKELEKIQHDLMLARRSLHDANDERDRIKAVHKKALEEAEDARKSDREEDRKFIQVLKEELAAARATAESDRVKLVERHDAEMKKTIERNERFVAESTARAEKRLQDEIAATVTTYKSRMEHERQRLVDRGSDRASDAEREAIIAMTKYEESRHEQALLKRHITRLQAQITEVQLASRVASNETEAAMRAVRTECRTALTKQAQIHRRLMDAEGDRVELIRDKNKLEYHLLSVHLRAELEREQLLLEARKRKQREANQQRQSLDATTKTWE